MNRAALAAAFRLSTSLPSTVHRKPAPSDDPSHYEDKPMRKFGGGARRLPVRAIRTLPGGQLVKRCSGCKVDHALDAFPLGNGSGGLHSHCREYHKQSRHLVK